MGIQRVVFLRGQCSFRQPNPSPNSCMQQNGRSASRTRSPRRRSPSGRMYRWSCKDYLKKELASTHFVKSGTFQNACSTRPRAVANLGKSAHMHIVRLMNSLVKGPKKNDDKSAVAMLKKSDLHESIWQHVVNLDQKSRKIGATG